MINHIAEPDFWRLFNSLTADVQQLANKNYAMLKRDPTHPSLQFKQLANMNLWSVRVGAHYRALARKHHDAFVWFWIGSHADYDDLIG